MPKTVLEALEEVDGMIRAVRVGRGDIREAWRKLIIVEEHCYLEIKVNAHEDAHADLQDCRELWTRLTALTEARNKRLAEDEQIPIPLRSDQKPMVNSEWKDEKMREAGWSGCLDLHPREREELQQKLTREMHHYNERRSAVVGRFDCGCTYWVRGERTAGMVELEFILRGDEWRV